MLFNNCFSLFVRKNISNDFKDFLYNSNNNGYTTATSDQTMSLADKEDQGRYCDFTLIHILL